MSKCAHELWEMDTAAHFDGLCPLCLQAEIEQLREKVRHLTKLLDDQLGTPCEQIRHAEALVAERERCAQVADEKAGVWRKHAGDGTPPGCALPLMKECEQIATAIRQSAPFSAASDKRLKPTPPE